MKVADSINVCKSSSNDCNLDSGNFLEVCKQGTQGVGGGVASGLERLGELSSDLLRLGGQLRDMVVKAVESRASFDDTERSVWQVVLRAGYEAMDLFVKLQGNGDLGEEVVDNGQQLKRSEQPVNSTIRSIFGAHEFQQYTYSAGANRKIELYTISARMKLPEQSWSYLLQEFSQMFCVDQAFHQASANLERVFGSKHSVDTLEQINFKMGQEADAFLDHLPTPEKSQESQILVATADCKGVPLVKADAEKVAAFETGKIRPGNRRMATVTSVYSVGPYIRTPEEIVASLFRDQRESDKKRPEPKFKHTTAHFPIIYDDGTQKIPVSGIHEGLAWINGQVTVRRQKKQPLVVLMDGQEALWEVAGINIPKDALVVYILDLIHVSTYIWEASAIFHTSRKDREAFARERLLWILRGKVKSVIRGLRRMAAIHRLKGDKLATITRICGYFEKHQDRMRYHEYLAAGYPIATGVIEGACRHLVKDRMERSGMRWTLESARNMLNVRAVFQSDYWNEFHAQRKVELNKTLHTKSHLIDNYEPLSLSA